MTRGRWDRLRVPLVIVWGSMLLGPVESMALAERAGAGPNVFEGSVPRAQCGPGSRPETGIQGEVPVADRRSGRSAEGYDCNLAVVGHYGPDDGFEGASWQMAWFGDCAYFGTRIDGSEHKPGTQVIDASDRTDPRFSTSLTTTAMQNPWESLKAHLGRGLLAGTLVGSVKGVFTGPGWFDVYDVSRDCRHPTLLASKPFPGLGHEGNWAQDGRTYYAAGFTPGVVTAIDVEDAVNPRALGSFISQSMAHGLGTSLDGDRLYLAHVNADYTGPTVGGGAYGRGSRLGNNGLAIYDVSDFNRRRRNPRARLISTLYWKDGSIGQHVLPVTRNGRPYVVFVDEFDGGGARIIDIGDERRPRIVSKLRTEIQMPEHQATFDAGRDYNGERGGDLAPLTYNTHYCSVDRTDDPTILVCSAFESGVRVFDIQNFSKPREIAYFNPGGTGNRLPGSYGGTTGGYTSAAPRVIAESGELWFTDQDRGFYVTRFTNGVWPRSRGPCWAAPVGPARPAQPASAAVVEDEVQRGALLLRLRRR